MKNRFNELANSLPMYSKEISEISQDLKNKATDIRFSVGFTPQILMGNEKFPLKSCPIVTKEAMNELIFKLCENSIYTHMEEIKQGFISFKNEFRIGLCGTNILKDEKTSNINNITSIIIRVPRIVNGCADELHSKIKNFNNGVLIVGEPSSGKTTLLRDIARILKNDRLVVLDERFELMHSISDIDLDILYSYQKSKGISNAVRNLGARYIICDELEESEISAVKNAVSCGVSLIATVHGNIKENIRPLILTLLETGAFLYVIELQSRDFPCRIKKVWEKDELLKIFRLRTNMLLG